MDLVIEEEQTMLARAAKDFATARSPLERARDGEPSREIWSEMAKLGWLGLTFSEEYGGAGLGHRYAMMVLEELGKNLVPEPLVGAIAAATAIDASGKEMHKRELLPAIASGERIVTLAYREAHSRFAPSAIDASAEETDDGYVLEGEKVDVEGGTFADTFIVSARTGRNLANVSLFVVPAKDPGVNVIRQSRIDRRSSAIVRFSSVKIRASQRLGAPEGGLLVLERAIDAGTLALSAEMLGSMNAAFAMTVEYLKTREQFGVPIGSFQALQHRAARLFVETELARSAVMNAAALLDLREGYPQASKRLDSGASARLAVSVAKAKCTDAFMLVANEAIQMHGGIGMTDEHAIGLYLKRARVAEMTYGDAAYHRDRFARLSGF